MGEDQGQRSRLRSSLAGMDATRELILQDVRCFRGTQRGRVRPMTLLVGENSTGKTTFLGCYRILHQVLSKREVSIDEWVDFNEEPFLMGSFRDIVRSRRGPGGRIDEFRLGLTVAPEDGTAPYEITAAFSEEGSQPVVSSLRYQFDPQSFLELRRDDNDETRITIPGCEVRIEYPLGLAILYLRMLTSEDPGPALQSSEVRRIVEYIEDRLPKKRKRGRNARQVRSRLGFPPGTEVIPVAPLRSKPKRTYDPVRETASPEGEHVPMLMMRLDHADRSHWNSLHDDLIEFGRESGLFADIKVRRHGKQMSDPFQLQVKVRSGPVANIMDVGYGVSQSLPILVDLLAAEDGKESRTFLMQQPEVHLHPRGQAELASLLVESFKRRGSRFLIETHSDYIVDRVRICVRKKILKADDVSILYFEPKRNAVVIHSMTLDDHGNLQDAPAGYRDFHAKESDQLLGFSE